MTRAPWAKARQRCWLGWVAHELTLLQPCWKAGLITLDAQAIRVMPKGRMFVRASGMVFDKYLTTQPTTAAYSKLI